MKKIGLFEKIGRIVLERITVFIVILSMIAGISQVSVSAEEKKETDVEVQCKASVLMEASSGTVIKSNNENEKLSPASITKIMTMILIFDAIHSGKIKLEDMATTSAHAKSMGGSQVFLEEGEQQSVETLIKCIIIASGNDASVTMAEHIAGSEEEFVKMMNERAQGLGMKNTHFIDCCGLTDSDDHYTTAMDVAIMSRELITKYPEVFQYSTIWMESFTHKTKKGESEFMLSNTNKLLKTNQYVKGLKTGSTSKAKYCVSTVAEKDGVELIAVIMAAPDYKARFAEAQKLINYGFSNCKVYKDEKNHVKEVNVNGGRKGTASVKNNKFSFVDTEGKDLSKMKTEVKMNQQINAPIKKGDVVGKIEYTLDGKKIGETNIVSDENVKKADYKFTFVNMMRYLLQIS
ncbi:D-alanyl-D-alanine carboxypeptidase family protein [uncultured Eubacterium sp.]|uniref:D-alanyl-D-alanine carboxypeptidase family protein n=1 Tax=uncultured Eubacterium sp. TaxID=165185 RepID=UPI0034A0B8D0